jgi:hypothetical protein
MITITSPISVTLPRKTKADKKILLNLNVYRNLHFQVNNQAKNVYNMLMYSQLRDIKLTPPIDMSFILYKKTKRLVDSSNIYCIVEKFFCDALVHWGCIKDDNDEYIGNRMYHKPVYGTGEDCCEIIITESI